MTSLHSTGPHGYRAFNDATNYSLASAQRLAAKTNRNITEISNMKKLLAVPAATRGGQENHKGAMKNGAVDKHAGSDGYKTIGSAESTGDSGQESDLRAYPRQAARQAAHQARRGGK